LSALSSPSPGGQQAGVVADLAMRRKLVYLAQTLARSAADGSGDPAELNAVLAAWAWADATGRERDGRLWWELKHACAEFYEARSSRARMPVESSAPLGANGVPTRRIATGEEHLTDLYMHGRYSRLGTVHSRRSDDAGRRSQDADLADCAPAVVARRHADILRRRLMCAA